jgi:hypothetical protein
MIRFTSKRDFIPMIPMGTVVTVCMFTGLIIAAPLPMLKSIPSRLKKISAYVVLAAGLWNVLWYGLQNLTEFWGMAALVSGVLMIVTAVYILAPSRLPGWLVLAKPVVLTLLLGCAMLYSITIARL